MKSFSNITNTLQTGTDQVINDLVNRTGLSNEKVTKLYESLSFNNEGNQKEIEKQFNLLFENPVNLGPDKFNLLDTEITTALDDKDYNKLTQLVYSITNIPELFDVVSVILKRLDIDDRFQKIIGKISEDFEISHLMESDKVSYVNNIADGSEVKSTIDLYSSLKTILSKNNKRWGHNYHLDNVYTSIWDYLNSEIEYLTTKDSVQQTNGTFHEELIGSIMMGNMNPMYRQVDILRNLIPDTQTLVFDMMLITTKFIQNNSLALSYLSVDTWNQYFNATEKLYSKILSSKKESRILAQKNSDSNYLNDPTFENPAFLLDLRWDDKKYNIYHRPLQFKAMIDCVYIVKSCSVDFQLGLRPILREWVTKAFEILSKGEKVIIEHKRISKHKNGY